jgi:hypothetical protein
MSKGEVVSVHMRAYEERGGAVHSYPWHQIGMSYELHAQTAFTPRKEYLARTEWEARWVPQPVWTL